MSKTKSNIDYEVTDKDTHAAQKVTDIKIGDILKHEHVGIVEVFNIINDQIWVKYTNDVGKQDSGFGIPEHFRRLTKLDKALT